MNSKLTPKERGLLKGAIRRVFSRSDLRRSIVDAAEINHSDPDRPRVKKWAKCKMCEKPTAKYQMQVDHILPIIPINTTLEEMTWDEVIDRTWCDKYNLQAVCITCHKAKSRGEAYARRLYKKSKAS